MDKDHIHLISSTHPKISPGEIVRIFKSITAREIFRRHSGIKKELWGEEFWSDGFFVNTVSKFGSEDTISKYVRNQGMEKEYKKLHCQQISFLSRVIDTP